MQFKWKLRLPQRHLSTMSFPYLSDLIYALSGYRLPLSLPMFGLFVASGALAAGACLRAELRRLYRAGRLGLADQRRQENGKVALVQVEPHMVVSDFTFIVLLTGVVGSRVFHILENVDMFMADPAAMIFSRSGLSIFGGLIFGAAAGLVLLRRWRISAPPFLDAIAPALMLGYAVGRIGCQVAGDGDWGIAANMVLKPDWLPTWFWAQTYVGNIAGIPIAAPGVYPTPVYETFMCLGCFALLWWLRSHPFRTGWLFAVYLLLAGIERLLVEQIRINVKLHMFSLVCTQAELIAVLFIALGLGGIVLLSRPRNVESVRAAVAK
jgi:phosphatidylglycerol:prolipoprotein diacylglycerol transferase